METEAASTTITTAELRTAVAGILDLVEKNLGSTIELGADYYWHIDSVDAFDVYKDSTPTIGQLSDDVASIRNDTGYLWHDLDHLLGILRRLSALDRI